MSDVVAGTPPIVPPEAFGRAPLDQRADLYSLGALAYWMLTGRHAYPARHFDELPTTGAMRPLPLGDGTRRSEGARRPRPAPARRRPTRSTLERGGGHRALDRHRRTRDRGYDGDATARAELPVESALHRSIGAPRSRAVGPGRGSRGPGRGDLDRGRRRDGPQSAARGDREARAGGRGPGRSSRQRHA